MSEPTAVAARVDEEREHLVAALGSLRPEQWRTPSVCAGWSVREVVVQRAGGNFDRAADGWATTDTRFPAELLAALEASEHKAFNVPGAPPEALLSHLVIHAEDVYRRLGVSSPTQPENARVVLEQLVTRGRGLVPPALLEGTTLTATDTPWTYGDGLEVSGPAVALLTTLAGRSAVLPELTGPGADQLRERLLARAVS